ncbi:hypothetical protein HDU87_001844 [Geranomyces variabilis]|uniref:Uncharacterized protein n=1 Tax=Geranomyces variabilis TaxID=109894 RepID=A0AAD5TS40_9FUNG|nr:hypothetical protein HDU87_001844 [Geranomyces variabilis]
MSPKPALCTLRDLEVHKMHRRNVQAQVGSDTAPGWGALASSLTTELSVAALKPAWRQFEEAKAKSVKLDDETQTRILRIVLDDEDSQRCARQTAAVYGYMDQHGVEVGPADLRRILPMLARARSVNLGEKVLRWIAAYDGWDHESVVQNTVELAIWAASEGNEDMAEKLLQNIFRASRKPKEVRETAVAAYASYAKSRPTSAAAHAFISVLLRCVLPSSAQLRRILWLSGCCDPPNRHTTPQTLKRLNAYAEAIQTQAARMGQRVEDKLKPLYLILIQYLTLHNGLVKAADLTALLGNYPGATLATNTLIGAYMARGSIERAQRVFDSMKLSGVPRDADTYTSMISGLVKAFERDPAQSYLDKAAALAEEANGCTFEKGMVYCNALVKLEGARFGFRGALSAAQKIFDAGCKPDGYTMSTLLVLCRKAGDVNAALKILEDGRRVGNEPTEAHCKLVLQMLAKKNDTARMAVLRDYMKERGFASNDSPADAILAFMLNGDETSLAAWAKQKVDHVREGQVDGFIARCLTGLADKGQTILIGKLITILRQQGYRVNAATFNAMLKGLAVKGELLVAEMVLAQMDKLGIKQDRVTSNIMVSICVNAGELTAANRYFRKMINTSPDLSPDRFTYATLIKGNVNRGRMDVAARLLASMKARRVEPDLPVYHCMLNGYARLGDERNVSLTVSELTGRGLHVSTRTYNSIISGFRKGGFAGPAVWWMKQMAEVGIGRDGFTLNDTLQLHVDQDDMIAAEKVFADMLRTDSVDRTSFNIMINGWAKIFYMEHAAQLLRQMKHSKIVPNHVTYTVMISGYAKRGDWRSAVRMFDAWLEQAQRDGHLASEPFAAIIYAMGVMFDKVPEAMAYWQKMVDLEIEATSSLYTVMMQLYAKRGLIMDVLAIFDRLMGRRDGNMAVVEAATACVAIDACGHLGYRRDLERVWRELRENEDRLKISILEWENVFNSMIEALCRFHQFEEAARMLTQEMVAARVQPTAKTFSTCLQMMTARQCDPKIIERVAQFEEKWKRK